MLRRLPLVARATALALLATACASVPPESIELSATIGRDLESLHAAHHELATRYFQRMHHDVDAFVDDVYRPFVIRAAMEELDLLAEIDAARRPGAELDPLDLMEIFVDETIARIEAYRARLHAPVAEQERRVLASIDAAHLRLRNANAIVTAHLASVRKLHDAQSEFLRTARLPEREQTLEIVTSVSDDLARLLADAGKAGSDLEGLPARIHEILRRVLPTPTPTPTP
jgi:hypothetical protein